MEDEAVLSKLEITNDDRKTIREANSAKKGHSAKRPSTGRVRDKQTERGVVYVQCVHRSRDSCATLRRHCAMGSSGYHVEGAVDKLST